MIKLLSVLVGMCLFVCSGYGIASEGAMVGAASASGAGLVFDPVELDMGEVLEGEKASATILIRNNSDGFAQIVKVESSCGCTTVEPDTRMLASGAFTPLHVEVDTFGKLGDIHKSITVTDQYGKQTTAWLSLHVQENPHAEETKRSIFDGKCATCHAEPAKGKRIGSEIYTAVCVMCHGKGAQGAYAPSLRAIGDEQILSELIKNGTGNHHMPAFSKEKGGPLNEEQIKKLAKWIISLDE